MRIRIAAAMLLLVMLLFPAGMVLVVGRSFDLTMERERTRALSEEAAIARAISLEIQGEEDKALYQAAQTAQSRYGSQTLSVILVRGTTPMAGETLPEDAKPLLACSSRATLLSKEAQTLYIAHRLQDNLVLLLASDVSPVYAMRAGLIRWALILLLIGLMVAVLLALLIAGRLTKPIRVLVKAADDLAQGRADTVLPVPGDDEVGSLTRSFSAMTEAVQTRENELREEADRRQLLIDALAHEMRTPLTAIVGGTDLLRMGRLKENQQQELLDTMAREGRRLSQMDERLLMLTRLTHDAPDFTQFSGMDMAQEALSVYENAILTGNDATFTGDRELMIVLLRNLVTNAQRAGGTEPVRVQMDANGFSVADSGCGMTPEQAAHAFDPFYKADKARTRKAGGAGLGLTLCKRIAELHRGTLAIESEIGRGTVITFRLTV